MAIYSCNLSSVGRTTHAAGTAGCHLAYIGREGAEPHIEAHGMPLDPSEARTWMDRQEVAARANARLVDKVRIAIPRELSDEQRLALVRDFVRGLTSDRVPWYFAIHQRGDDAHNPHAHIVLHDREIGTGARVLHLSDSARDRAKLGMEPKAVEWIRERWEHFANDALTRAGHDLRVDRRTLEAQGIDRAPTIHLGPRAQHIESFVERPRSKKRTTPLGREIDYPRIDGGKTRAERNAEIIDLNLERNARSPNLETRTWAMFEKGQRDHDRRLEKTLAEQARTRTKEERALKAGFRTQLRALASAKHAAYLEGVTKQRAHLAPRVASMRDRQGRERIALHRDQTSFWSKLTRAVDITGGTRRRHQATRRALVAEHREERDVLAREMRAAWAALKDAVNDRFHPQRDALVLQRRDALRALREMHLRAEAMADGKRQRREADRERYRVKTAEGLRVMRAVDKAADDTWRERSRGTARRGFGEQRLADRSMDQGRSPPARGR